MHICTVIPSYQPIFGGIEVGVHTLLKHLANTTSHKFSVITPTTDKNLPRFEIIDNVSIYRYQYPKIWGRGIVPLLSGFWHIPNLINQLKPDL
jgi:hypothetical protein